MSQLTEIKTIRFSRQQIETFEILKQHNINVNQFIRLSIKEKIQREWKIIKVRSEKLPF